MSVDWALCVKSFMNSVGEVSGQSSKLTFSGRPQTLCVSFRTERRLLVVLALRVWPWVSVTQRSILVEGGHWYIPSRWRTLRLLSPGSRELSREPLV